MNRAESLCLTFFAAVTLSLLRLVRRTPSERRGANKNRNIPRHSPLWKQKTGLSNNLVQFALISVKITGPLKRIFLFIAIVTSSLASRAQIGGMNTYLFLSLPPSARITALGGVNTTLFDHDLTTQLANPASLNPQMSRHISFGTTVYPGKINFGNLAYAQKFKIPGTFGFGLQYIAYGKFQQTDETGAVLGTFRASEMNLYAGYGYQFGKIFSAGVNAKFVYSNLADQTSVGMAMDLAAMLNDTARRITVSLVAKNIGGQFKPYGNVRESIPFDLQAGVSFGFKHFPVRFHLNLHHLQTWDIRYDNPADQGSTLFLDSSQLGPKQHVVDKIFRHVVIGVELNIKKVVFFDVAYNHLRQQELSLTTKRGIPGLSFGLGLHIKQFDFNYGIQAMGQGGGLHYFTLSVNTAGFIKKKTVPAADDKPQKM